VPAVSLELLAANTAASSAVIALEAAAIADIAADSAETSACAASIEAPAADSTAMFLYIIVLGVAEVSYCPPGAPLSVDPAVWE
jgi:hypothetical protein